MIFLINFLRMAFEKKSNMENGLVGILIFKKLNNKKVISFIIT